jgi:chemotaxis protein methyltransferase CheR
MSFTSEILGLPKGTDTLLRDLVHDRTGMYFDSGKIDMLTDKLSTLVVKRGFNSFLDYYYFLKYDENAGAEWENVMNAISIGETYFWREIDQVRHCRSPSCPARCAQTVRNDSYLECGMFFR